MNWFQQSLQEFASQLGSDKLSISDSLTLETEESDELSFHEKDQAVCIQLAVPWDAQHRFRLPYLLGQLHLAPRSPAMPVLLSLQAGQWLVLATYLPKEGFDLPGLQGVLEGLFRLKSLLNQS